MYMYMYIYIYIYVLVIKKNDKIQNAHAFYELWPAKKDRKEREKILSCQLAHKSTQNHLFCTWFCKYHKTRCERPFNAILNLEAR